MSNKKGIIKQVKDLIFNTEEEITFVDVKTDSGRILRVSAMEVGGTVVEITEEGEAELEDGSYILDDGKELLVEAGKIAEIKESEEEEEGTDNEEVVVEEAKAELFMDITLKDGPIVHIVTATEGSVDAGDKVMIDGVEAGPGEYTTNDSRVITVGDSGVITEVKAVVTEEETPEAVVEETPEVVEQTIEEKVEALTEKLAELEGAYSAVKEENETLRDEVSKFAKLPAAESTKTKVDFKAQSRQEKLEFYSKRK